MNQLFGYESSRREGLEQEVAIEGTQPLKSDPSWLPGDQARLRLLVGSGCQLSRWKSPEGALSVYVWGAPGHARLTPSEIAGWCGDVLRRGRYAEFRELFGPFVIVGEEPGKRRLIFVSDILGVRPMFVGIHGERIVFGSDAWRLWSAGLVQGAIDYDAVAAWVVYGYNCKGGSMFTGLHRLPPGSVVSFENGRRTEIRYAELRAGNEVADVDEAAEALHGIVSRTTVALLRSERRVSCALSGGFDSRYLAALAHSLELGVVVDLATVAVSPEEREVAERVARVLGLPLKVYPVRASIWDLYDQVYHFMADGFPISKFVTHYIAQQYSPYRMLNGYLGDSLMRGSHDQFKGRYESEWTEDLADVLQRKHLLVRLDLFPKTIRKRLLDRTRVPMEEAVELGSHFGKVFTWTDLYYRQRCYISNNFLQHIDINEALLPFYSWDLLSYKCLHDYRVFGRKIYERVFDRHFHQLGEVPHASDLAPAIDPAAPIARCEKVWAMGLISRITTGWLPLVDRGRCRAMLAAGLMGIRRAEWTILNLQRLYVFERRIREAGITFDWGRL